MLYVIWTATKTMNRSVGINMSTHCLMRIYFFVPVRCKMVANAYMCMVHFKLRELYKLMSIKSNRNVSTQNINNSKSRKHHLQLPLWMLLNVVECCWMLRTIWKSLFIVCDKQNNANLFMARVMSMHKFHKRTSNWRSLLHLFSLLGSVMGRKTWFILKEHNAVLIKIQNVA